MDSSNHSPPQPNSYKAYDLLCMIPIHCVNNSNIIIISGSKRCLYLCIHSSLLAFIWYPRLKYVLVVCAHSDVQWSGLVHYYCKYIRTCVSLEAAIISMYALMHLYLHICSCMYMHVCMYMYKYFTCMHVCISRLPCKHTLIDISYYTFIYCTVCIYVSCTYKHV